MQRLKFLFLLLLVFFTVTASTANKNATTLSHDYDAHFKERYAHYMHGPFFNHACYHCGHHFKIFLTQPCRLVANFLFTSVRWFSNYFILCCICMQVQFSACCNCLSIKVIIRQSWQGMLKKDECAYKNTMHDCGIEWNFDLL